METKFVEIAATFDKLRHLQTQQKLDFEDCLALDDYEINWYKEKLKNIEMENAALRDYEINRYNEKLKNIEIENAALRGRLHAVLMAASGLALSSKN